MEVYKKLIFGLNFLFIIINLIFLFLYSNNFIIENNLIFKTTDTFNIDLSKNNYSDISFYLNNKYDINKVNIIIFPNKRFIKKNIKTFQHQKN